MKKLNKVNIYANIFFVIFSLWFVIPFIYVVSISFTNEASLLSNGYRMIPEKFDLAAYRYVFANPKLMINAYKLTAFTAVVGTFLSVLMMAMVAYPLSRKSFRYKGPITFFIFFTMLFGGGMIPTYILITQYLHLGNTVGVYIVSGLANAFHIIILKTFFQQLPISLVESATIDGASEFRIFLQIIAPLSKPVLATIALFNLLSRWNDWMTSLLYVRVPELYTLQFLLQKVLRDAEFVKQMAKDIPTGLDLSILVNNVPTESMKFALCIIVAGPMLLVFPFFQKYFTRGLTMGAVKG